jgi:hypothetical protein
MERDLLFPGAGGYSEAEVFRLTFGCQYNDSIADAAVDATIRMHLREACETLKKTQSTSQAPDDLLAAHDAAVNRLEATVNLARSFRKKIPLEYRRARGFKDFSSNSHREHLFCW